MINDGYLNPALVYDESKLNTKRILVVWLSPNTWGMGYRYGNVQLVFDWKELIENKRFYWIESIPYKIEALRILITDQNRDSEFERCDPTIEEGPCLYDQETDNH